MSKVDKALEKMPRIVCIGETVWDCFPEEKILGGAPFNVATTCQALGADAIMVSRVGQDSDGEEILARMKTAGMTRDHIQTDPDHPTGRVEITLSDAGGHEFNIIEDVAWDYIRWNDETQRAMTEAQAVCFGTLAQRHENSRHAIRRFLRETPRALRLYDVNLRRQYYDREVLTTSLELATVVKLNDDELQVLESFFPDAFERGIEGFLHDFDLELLAVTRGSDGCALYRRDEQVELPGVEVTTVDTVGAGDAFAAMLMLMCLAGEPLRVIAEEANVLGAYVATQRGATPNLANYKPTRRKRGGR